MKLYLAILIPVVLPGVMAAQLNPTTTAGNELSGCDAAALLDSLQRDPTAGHETPPSDVSSPPGGQPKEPVRMLMSCVEERETGIGRVLHVRVANLREAIMKDRVDPSRFVLYLGGRPLWNVSATLVDPGKNRLAFLVARTDTSRDAWSLLLGKPSRLRRHGVSVGVGYESLPQLDIANEARRPAVTVLIMGGWRLTFGLLILGGLLVSFWWLVIDSNIIRDSSPPKPPKDAKKPYSLGRLQMAVWFFLILAAFVFLWVITGSVETLNAQALILIGIGTGTALGAAAVDASKRTTAEEALMTLEPKRASLDAEISEIDRQLKAAQAPDPAAQKLLAEKTALVDQIRLQIADAKALESQPVSVQFWTDILTDANGISFHRFQMLAWTIVLGFIFVVGVYERLAMPEFNTTLLALMGISAGTYLGFKIPERQS